MLNMIKKNITFVIVALLFLTSFYFIYEKINPKELAKNLVASSGRIDGDLILLNTKYSARVDKIWVKDGDAITLGQSIAHLKSDEFINNEKSITESILSLEKEKLSFAQTITAQSLELQLLQNTLPKLVTIKENSVKNLQNSLLSVNVELTQLDLNLQQTKKEYTRYKQLFTSGSISPEKFELIELKYKTTQKEFDKLKIAKQKIENDSETARNYLEIEKENLAKIEILKQNILASRTKLSSLENKIKQVQASKDEVSSMISELTLTSPINGFVIEKIANEGEVIGAGMVVATLSDTSSYYLKLFVDTLNNGKIKIGDKAVIFLDSYPASPIHAKVTAISAQAEFTPKEVNIRSDRIQRVYALHVTPLSYDPHLKLGLPAVGIVAIDNAPLPTNLNEIPQI